MAKKQKYDDEGNEIAPAEDATEAASTPALPEAPDPWTVLARIATAMELLAQRQVAAPDTGNAELMQTLSQALVRVSESNIEGSKLIAAEHQKSTQANRPSNQVIPNVSVFNRRGTKLEDYQKPKLKCLMMLPWLAEWESLTREEVELLNLLESGSYVLKRIDRTKVTVTITIEYKADGHTPSRLLMNHDTAFNNDNFRMMPPLVDMLRDILKQHDRDIRATASTVLSDEEEEALIEAGELSVST